MACCKIPAASKVSESIPQFRGIGIQQETEVRGGVSEPSLDQRRNVPLFKPGRLVNGFAIDGGANIGLCQRDAAVTAGIFRPRNYTLVRLAPSPRPKWILVYDMFDWDRVC